MTLTRTLGSHALARSCTQWRALDEIYAGIFDGMTYEEIEAAAPAEFAARKKSKLAYRYPRGESYLDVITRLDPVIHAIERHKVPVVIVAHQVSLFYTVTFRANPSHNLTRSP